MNVFQVPSEPRTERSGVSGSDSLYRLLRCAPCAALIALFFLAAPAKADPPKREAFEVAVENAIQYLASAQNPDGSWNSGGNFGGGFRGGQGREPAVTALCVMAFLSAGHMPGEGKHGAVIEKGIQYISGQQQANGVFANGHSAMYSHGICTLMVAEVIGLMPDRTQAARLRKQLEAAVKLIRSAQSQSGNTKGGWRYSIEPRDADMSVTAWQVMALRAAKNVGCDVPPTIIDNAVDYVKRSYDANSWGYRYTPYGHVTVPCTGAAVLSLELCGKEYHRSEQSMNAAAYINHQNNILSQNRPHFFYGIYYTSQAMFQIGGDHWKRYRQILHALLLAHDGYPQRPGGFWTSNSPDDANAGVNYCTAMAVLALTVEFRFLPIYQRGEEPEERGDK